MCSLIILNTEKAEQLINDLILRGELPESDTQIDLTINQPRGGYEKQTVSKLDTMLVSATSDKMEQE